MLQHTVVFGLLLSLAVAAMAEEGKIYRQPSPEGGAVFTDQPAPDAQPVDLPNINTAPPPENLPLPAARPEQEDAEPSDIYTRLAISEPADEAIIPNGLAPPPVQVAIQPALYEGHRLRLLVDGSAAATSNTGSFQLERLSRGSHTLQVVALDARGEELQRSGSVSIFVYWPGGKNR